MGRRGRPPKRPASATSSAEQHMKRVRDICLNSRFVNIGENGKKWQQHRRACEGSQPGFDFVGHLLSLHDVHCSRAPPENVDVKLEVDDEALHGDNGSLDVVQVSLDGDLARQWRHLQKMAGYEAAEMEYLCWLMTVAEQMLGWKSQSEEKDNDDRAEEEDEDYTPEPPRQRRRRTEPTPATAGTSFDSPVYETPTELPEYGLHSGDDSNSGSGGVPGGSRHADSEEEQEDVKPEIEPAQGTLTKFTIKWADKPSTSTAPTSIETETTSHMKEQEEDMRKGQAVPSVRNGKARKQPKDAICRRPDDRCQPVNDTLPAMDDDYEDLDDEDDCEEDYEDDYEDDDEDDYEDGYEDDSMPDSDDYTTSVSRAPTSDRDPNFTVTDLFKNMIKPSVDSQSRFPVRKQPEVKPPKHRNRQTVSTKVPKKRGPYKKRTPKEGQEPREQKKRVRKPYIIKDPKSMDSYCHQCEKLFTERYALLMHCHKDHGGELPTKDHLCIHCGKRYGTFPILRSHIRHVHIEQPRMTCPVCNKQIKKVGFNGHMARHKEERSCCDICGQMLNKYGMEAHIQAVHLQMRTAPCEWPGCGKVFKNPKHLKQHMLLHTDEKPYGCQHCDYRCRQTSSLTWHMKHTHPNITYYPAVPKKPQYKHGDFMC